MELFIKENMVEWQTAQIVWQGLKLALAKERKDIRRMRKEREEQEKREHMAEEEGVKREGKAE